jgi:hypothetical protein
MLHSSQPPSWQAGTKHNSGARFRVIADATSERRRGASRPSAIIAISDRHANRDDHVHQEPPAIRGRKNVLDEQILGFIANAAIRKREV